MKKGKVLIATSLDKSDEFLYGKGYLYLNESKFIQAPKISDAINYLIDVETKRDIKFIWHHIDNSIGVGDTIHKSTGAEIKIVKIDENNYYYTAHALMGTHSVDKKMIDDRIKSGSWKVKHTYAKGSTIVSKKVFDNGGVIPNNYEEKSPKKVWDIWSKEQRVHFLKDHPTYETDGYGEGRNNYFNADELKKYSESSYADLPQDIKNNIFYHTDEGQYKKGATINMKKSIEFRKLAKSGNFDIIVPEGRYEIEVSNNGAEIVNIINPTGTRIKYTHSTIHQKYGNEIANYFYGDKYKKGSTIKGSGELKISELKKGDFLKKKGSNLELKVVEVGKGYVKLYNDVTDTKTSYGDMSIFVLSNGSPYPQYKKGSTIKGAGANGKYLDSVSADKKTQILRNIANHYGVSLAEAEAEVKDADAEMLYEYITNNALRLEVYNDFESKKYKKGSTIDSFGTNYNVVFEKPNSDIAWKKTINANSIKEAKKTFLQEHPTCTILNIGESYKKGSTIKSCNCEYSIGGL